MMVLSYSPRHYIILDIFVQQSREVSRSMRVPQLPSRASYAIKFKTLFWPIEQHSSLDDPQETLGIVD